MQVVTISREIGSNGTQIAKAVAAHVGGVAVVERQVLTEMARQMAVAVDVIVQAEERLLAKPIGVSDEMRALFAAQRDAAGSINERQFIQQMTVAIKRLAETDVVFIGRGAQMILQEHPNALHVHLYAPTPVRALRIQQRRSLPNVEAALRVVQQVDEQHKNWFRHFFSGVDWKHARHYHLMIDTARIAPEVATALIVQAVQSAPPPQLTAT